jgi:hypothetical protein
VNKSPIYERASDASPSVKVILYFSKTEHGRVIAVLKKLTLEKNENIVLIDARSDNKPSGSRAA